MKETKDPIRKSVDLGRCGSVILHVSGDRKRLLLEFDTEAEGFDNQASTPSSTP